MLSDIPSKPDLVTTKDKLDYTWKWFEYQAGQRLTAFNFLVVLIGILSVGYYKAFHDKAYWYALAVGLFAAFISFVFYRLDLRNEELVNVGRRALMKLENQPEFSDPADKDDACRLAVHASKSAGYYWLQYFEIVLIILFLVASAVSGLKLAGIMHE